MERMVSGSIPASLSPAKASPLSLRRMRLYLSADIGLLTQLQPMEGENLYGFEPLRLGGCGEQFVHGLLAVLDENLIEEAILLEELGDLAFDDFLHHVAGLDRKSTRLNSSHVKISYAVFCLK